MKRILKKALLFVLLGILTAAFVFGVLNTASAESLDAVSTSAQSAVVIEVFSGRVLYEKNSLARLPMASTTKIMTALIAVENALPDDIVTIDKRAVGIEGSSVYLREGERWTVKELLYGLMLQSGNDCAVAIALHIGGSIGCFADIMNKKAAELGLCDTHFVNPHGLHDDNHYTSAKDLGIIACAAMKNELFREIVSTKLAKVGEGENARYISNKNKLLTSLDGANGVKTGYTKRAGRCFVGAANINGTQLVCVVLNCGPMFEESRAMLSELCNKYKTVTIIPKNKLCMVTYSGNKAVYYYCKDGFSYPLTDGEFENISKKIEWDENGGFYKLTVSFGKQLIFSQKLYTI